MDIHNLQLSVGNVDVQFLTIMYIHKTFDIFYA